MNRRARDDTATSEGSLHMCRLLAYAAPSETTVSEVIGEANAEAFQQMTSVHNDGWGTAWLASGPGEELPEVESARVSTPGQADPMLTAALESVPSYSRLVHLRLATDRLKRTTVNTHPFVANGIAFAHNGSIIPVERFEELLSEEELRAVSGTTDSELYFSYVRKQIREGGGTVAEGVVRAVQRLRRTFPNASLNAVVLTDAELIVIHANSTAHVTDEDFRSYGIDPALLPDDHDENYYKLAMLQRPDGTTVFSSTGINLAGWSRVPDDTITRIDLDTLELSQRKIFGIRETASRRGHAALNDSTIDELARHRQLRAS
ncbi:class II glutamine amidotransferase [Gulosibacter sediminis]|uniref:class II glutamine amidotransferase n=1 Tax=Gulosibacter sediminis TaxID=1729695 RepID=UPI0024AE84A6|nr:class II glutamine amidotransferase [Gulosibacter sediminis]